MQLHDQETRTQVASQIRETGSRRPAVWVAVAGALIVTIGVSAYLIGSGGSGVSTVAGDGVLTVGVMTDFDALPFSDSTAEPVTGFEVELLEEMARRAGLTTATAEPLSSYSPAALHHLALAETGVVDVVAQGVYVGLYEHLREHADEPQFGSIDASRADNPATFTIPYYFDDFAVVVNTVRNADIRSLDDLGPEDEISVWEDSPADVWAVRNLVPSGVRVRRVTSGSALSPLASAAISDVVAVVHSAPIAERLVAGEADLEIVQVIDAKYPLAFAIDPSNPDLHSALNTALDDMIADGTYDSIHQRWFADSAGSVAP